MTVRKLFAKDFDAIPAEKAVTFSAVHFIAAL
jgi:hypothetical protein